MNSINLLSLLNSLFTFIYYKKNRKEVNGIGVNITIVDGVILPVTQTIMFLLSRVLLRLYPVTYSGSVVFSKACKRIMNCLYPPTPWFPVEQINSLVFFFLNIY